MTEIERLREALVDALFVLDGVADGDFAPDGSTVKNAMSNARAALSTPPAADRGEWKP